MDIQRLHEILSTIWVVWFVLLFGGILAWVMRPGSRETALVTAGKVRLVVGEANYDLQDGDSVTFDADLPHHFENPTETDEARFISVVSAGLRRS